MERTPVTNVRPPKVTLAPARLEDVDRLGEICHEAFTALAEHHGFPSDFPTVEDGRRNMQRNISRETVYGVAAFLAGSPVGSNYMSLLDEVSGVGPISVAPEAQGHGVGRGLMQAVLDHARDLRIERVRLMQDAFNTTSLSLYTALGFEVRQACALFELHATDSEPAANVRLVTADDLPAIETLGRDLYKVSRRDEVASAIRNGLEALLTESNGRPTGYLVPATHGMAHTVQDALSLVREAARRDPSGAVRFFCPLSLPSFFRAVQHEGGRVLKVMNLMSSGPYEEPEGVWLPSFLY